MLTFDHERQSAELLKGRTWCASSFAYPFPTPCLRLTRFGNRPGVCAPCFSDLRLARERLRPDRRRLENRPDDEVHEDHYQDREQWHHNRNPPDKAFAVAVRQLASPRFGSEVRKSSRGRSGWSYRRRVGHFKTSRSNEFAIVEVESIICLRRSITAQGLTALGGALSTRCSRVHIVPKAA